MPPRLRIFGPLSVLLLLSLAPLHGLAQDGSFRVAQHGTQVGTATVTVKSGPDGIETTTVLRVSMKGLTYDLSKTEHLNAAGHVRHVDLSATVNNAAVKVTAAHGAGQFLLTISSNGQDSTVRLAAHAGAVFLPDFDPGALDTLLTLAAANNNRDLWAILPKKSAEAAASIVPVVLATYADEQGTLDGKPVPAHHLVATIAGARTDLFSGPGNHLLQAELPQQGFALIRDGFVLTPPTKAGAPPAAPPQQAPRPAPQSPSPAAPQAPAAAPVQP